MFLGVFQVSNNQLIIKRSFAQIMEKDLKAVSRPATQHCGGALGWCVRSLGLDPHRRRKEGGWEKGSSLILKLLNHLVCVFYHTPFPPQTNCDSILNGSQISEEKRKEIIKQQINAMWKEFLRSFSVSVTGQSVGRTQWSPWWKMKGANHLLSFQNSPLKSSCVHI